MWQCTYCPFTSSRKWNTQVHEKRKHQDQISTSNGNDQRKRNEYYPVQGGETPIVYQQHIQEQHPLYVVHINACLYTTLELKINRGAAIAPP